MFSKLFRSKKNEDSVVLSGLTEEQRASLFEKYVFSKFDKKYFKLLNRRSDGQANEFTPDLEYEFRHNAFVRKFAVVAVFKQDGVDGKMEVDNKMLEDLSAYSTKTNLELYIILGMGVNPEKPQHVYTIPLIHFKTNPVSLNSLEVFKKDPGADFFYQRDIDCLT